MKLLKLAVLTSSILLSVNAFADCPVEMSEQQILDCIVYEGAGDFDAAREIVQESNDARDANAQVAKFNPEEV